MTTSLNSTIPARDVGYQLVHFLRKRFAIGGVGGLATTVSQNLGVLPANAAVVGGLSGVWQITDLDGTTNTLDVGFSIDSLSASDVNAYSTALALAITTGGFVPFDEIVAATGVTAKPRSVDTNVIVTFTGTATTGLIDVIMGFVPLNV
jgi:hypothetical protein